MIQSERPEGLEKGARMVEPLQIKEGGTISDHIRSALEQEDPDQALADCAKLPNEYALMFSLFNNIFTAFLPYLIKNFFENQSLKAKAIEQQIRRGEAKQALRLLAEKQEEYGSLHQNYTLFFAHLLDHLLQTGGSKALFMALEQLGEHLKSGIARQEKMDSFQYASLMQAVHSQNLAHFTMEEGENKFTFSLSPCGTGGRLLRSGFYKSEKMYVPIGPALSCACKGRLVPAYCAHCLFWFEILPSRWFGRPLQATWPPEKPADPCMIYVYKDIRKIPAYDQEA